MKPSSVCLPESEIPLLLSGDMPPDEAAAAESHIAECESCRSAIESIIADSRWWDDARKSLVASATRSPLQVEVTHDTEPTTTATLLDLLGPTDDPNMLGRIGPYEIIGLLGQGGMGAVFKGFDRSLNRFVAIKMLLPHLAASGAARKRFAREGQAVAAVVDDHVMAIHCVDEWQGVPYLVMTYSRGVSLQKRLSDNGPLEVREILRIGMQAAKGLAAAHAQGIVHRDIKPANIFLDQNVERVQLMDFGLARAVDDASLTRSGTLAGTPQYMSPEQARAETVDHRSDLFSLGSVMYAMCTGHAPFRAESSYSVLRLITDKEPRPIREINPDIPEWLSAIIGKLMAKHAGERFGSAKEVAEILEECLAHMQRPQPTAVPLPTTLVRARKEARISFRKSVSLGVFVMLTSLCLIVAAMFGFQIMAPPDIAGTWESESWGQVLVMQENAGKYTATYNRPGDSKHPGVIHLTWSAMERRYNGTWSEGDDRFGEVSLRLINNELRGAQTTDTNSQFDPGTPRLTDFALHRSVDGKQPDPDQQISAGAELRPGANPKRDASDDATATMRLRERADKALDNFKSGNAEAETVFRACLEFADVDPIGGVDRLQKLAEAIEALRETGVLGDGNSDLVMEWSVEKAAKLREQHPPERDPVIEGATDRRLPARAPVVAVSPEGGEGVSVKPEIKHGGYTEIPDLRTTDSQVDGNVLLFTVSQNGDVPNGWSLQVVFECKTGFTQLQRHLEQGAIVIFPQAVDAWPRTSHPECRLPLPRQGRRIALVFPDAVTAEAAKNDLDTIGESSLLQAQMRSNISRKVEDRGLIRGEHETIGKYRVLFHLIKEPLLESRPNRGSQPIMPDESKSQSTHVQGQDEPKPPATAIPLIDAAKELAALQGTWCFDTLQFRVWPEPIGIGTDSNGRTSEKRMVVKRNQITWTDRQGEQIEVSFTIDPFVTPKQIDFTFLRGPNKGEKSLGIYEPQVGNDNYLWLCMTNPGIDAPRPIDISYASQKQQSMIGMYKVASPEKPSNEKALERFQGIWNITLCDSALRNYGATPEEASKSQWTIKGDEVLWNRQGEVWRLKLDIDPSKRPREMDLTYLSGPFRGQKCLGMYEFGGIDEMCLNIAIQDPGATVPRPQTIAMTGSGKTGLIFLRPSQPSDTERQIGAFQGTWTLRNYDTGKNNETTSWPMPQGKGPDKSGEGSELRWQVKGNEITWTGSDGEVIRTSFTVDPTKRPKQIDLTFLSGTHKGETCSGIYHRGDLDENILWVCIADPGSKTARPTTFSYQFGEGRSLLSLYPFESSNAAPSDASQKP